MAEDTKPVLEEVVQVVEIGSKCEEPMIVRLTPTGKISHAKTRVYTQRYRKEWEHMTDFKDWLTSVPNEATRAYCKFCERNLHAHRLSLLKHMCTLKHQRAAAQYNKRQTVETSEPDESDVSYVIERLDEDDEENNGSYEGDATYIEEEEEENQDDIEEIVEESENEDCQSFKKIRLQKEEQQDTLAQAIAQSNFLTESNEPIHLEMVVESDHENDDDDGQSYSIVKCTAVSTSKDQDKAQTEPSKKMIKLNSNDKEQKENIDNEFKSDSKNTDISNKTYFLSSSGGKYTLVKGNLPTHLVVNQLMNKNLVAGKSTKNSGDTAKVTTAVVSNTSAEPKNKNVFVVNTVPPQKPTMSQKPIVTTHVVETSKGIPVAGLQVSLYKLQDGKWTFIHESMTTANGNCNNFSHSDRISLSTGRFKLHYDVEKYYNMRKVATIYPFIEIVFDIKDPNTTHHIPLLLSPCSYSTYKGGSR